MSPRHVLFISPGDATCAQMAAGLLHHLAGDTFSAASAGTAASAPPPAAVGVMAELGIDLGSPPVRTLDQYAGQAFDEQVLLCDGTTEK